jgi:hypothetical protein
MSQQQRNGIQSGFLFFVNLDTSSTCILQLFAVSIEVCAFSNNIWQQLCVWQQHLAATIGSDTWQQLRLALLSGLHFG